MKKIVFGLLTIALFITPMIINIPVQSADGTSTPLPTYTFYPTYTPYPTYTLYPTYTPNSASTKARETVTATNTPQSGATETPMPLEDYATVQPDAGTLSNPAPQFTRVFTDYKGKHLAVMVMAAYKGPQVDKDLQRAYDYSAPPDGMLNVIVYVTVDYIKGQGDEELTFTGNEFSAVSNRKEIPMKLFDNLGGRITPAFWNSGSVYSGGIAEGWIHINVFENDPQPLLKFQPSSGLLGPSTNPVFFSLDKITVYKSS